MSTLCYHRQGANRAKLEDHDMAEEEAKKNEPQAPENDHFPVTENESEKEDLPKGVGQELSVIAVPQEKATSSAVQKFADPATKKDSGDSVDIDSVLARVETEKRLALIKAWEESEKTKAENKAYKKLSAVGLWEDSKKASVEAQHKKIEEKLEKEKANYVEKIKNRIAEIHQSAEEKRAMVEAQRKEEFLKVEDTASKFRASGHTPRKLLACFSG